MKDELVIVFEQCRPQLRSYILRMTASVQDTEDIVQDTYVKAHNKIDTFKGESSLKTWLFAIASNITRDHLRARKRWPENVSDICRDAAMSNEQFFAEAMQIRATSPQGNFEIKEHITFCFTCIAKSLPLEQHLAVMLKEVYEFKVAEIAEIMSESDAMVKYYLHVGRGKMNDVFDRRCALINKEGICHQCSELNGIFNPKQDTQAELVKLDLVKQAANKDKEHLFDLRMKLIKEIDPFESGAAALQLHHLQHNKEVMDKFLGES